LVWARLLGWLVAAVIADAATKAAAVRLRQAGVLPGLIAPTSNPGLPLGAHPGFPVAVVAGAVMLVGTGGAAVWLALHGRIPAWAAGLLVGGGAANLGDRVLFGAVHDWLHLGPTVANLADFLLLAGALGAWVCLTRHRSPTAGDDVGRRWWK
jgi:lipoprotein signal peptidase